MTKTQGLVYLFTGDGKGKTSAALGIALRSLCISKRVAWISWYKQANWPISELNWPKFMPIEFYLLGKGFMIKQPQHMAKLKTGGLVVDTASQLQHKKAAQKAFLKAQKLLQTQDYDLLILDEINNAVADKLLDIKIVLKLISQRNATHLVLTGRSVNKELIKVADLVSEIKNIKHPYDQGLTAVRGLDF